MAMSVTVPRYTVDDLERLPDDGNRYELLDGILLVTPFAEAVHQVVANRLSVALVNGALGHAAVVSPGVIVSGPRTQLQPDILVYPAAFPATAKWQQITEHWLAVEIFSPSSRVYDRQFKRGAYLTLGVREAWLVDIEDRSVDVWRSRDLRSVHRDAVRWVVPTTDIVVTIELADIFAGFG